MVEPFPTRRDEIAARETSSAELMRKEELTEEEAAELFRESPHIIRQAVRSGDLPAKMAGDQIIAIRREDLTGWIKRRGGV